MSGDGAYLTQSRALYGLANLNGFIPTANLKTLWNLTPGDTFTDLQDFTPYNRWVEENGATVAGVDGLNELSTDGTQATDRGRVHHAGRTHRGPILRVGLRTAGRTVPRILPAYSGRLRGSPLERDLRGESPLPGGWTLQPPTGYGPRLVVHGGRGREFVGGRPRLRVGPAGRNGTVEHRLRRDPRLRNGVRYRVVRPDRDRPVRGDGRGYRRDVRRESVPSRHDRTNRGTAVHPA
jgi:hypothetical protein